MSAAPLAVQAMAPLDMRGFDLFPPKKKALP